MPWCDAFFDQRGAGRERERGLRDVVVRVATDAAAELRDLLAARGRAHQHPVAAGAVHFLDHQFPEVLLDIGEVFGAAQAPGGDVAQDRLLAQIEAHHLGHIGVHGFVVGHAGADGVRQHHVAGAVHREQPRHAQHGIGAEGERVEEGVVDAAVDHIDPARAAGGAHVDEAAAHEEILPLDQRHTHLSCEEGVLEVRAVEAPGREHHHVRIVDRRGLAQRTQQQVRVVLHRRHAVLCEEFREEPHHHAAVLEHVRHARGHPQIVLEYVVVAVGMAHQVDARDVGIDAAGQGEPVHRHLVLGVAQHQVRRHKACLEDALLAVDVAEEGIERRHALAQSALECFPLPGGDDAGHEVEGDQPLRAIVFTVQCEGDTHALEQEFGLAALCAQLLLGHAR